MPVAASAQDDTAARLSPVIRLPEITLYAYGGDDDANSIVARELAVGGKVATSILDTPASVSVITQAEIERRAVGGQARRARDREVARCGVEARLFCVRVRGPARRKQPDEHPEREP